MSDAELAELCASCGACCNGTIFSRGTLEPEEAASLRAHLTVEPGSSTFRQPCSAHRTAGCSVYDLRPAACRRYRCKLHQEVGDGQVTLDDALERVRRIRALSGAIGSRLPSTARATGIWEGLMEAAGTAPAEIARRDEALALDVAELTMRLNRDLGIGVDARGTVHRDP